MTNEDEFGAKPDQKIEHLIEKYVKNFFTPTGHEVVRIRHNIWTVREVSYSFNIIITSLLVIFDAILFDRLPENKYEFFEDLLSSNAHLTKSSKLCLVKESIHLRIIRGLEDFDYSEFTAHVNEYREIFLEIQDKLAEKYFQDDM